MVLADLYRKFDHNRSLIYNIVGTFAVKGGTMLLSLISMPLYLNYFENNILLGVWFTMHTVLSWILVFDLGIGNGLRNHLTTALARNDRDNAKAYISSAYIMFGAFVAILSLLVLGLSHVVSWNGILNVSEHVIDPADLHQGVNITLVGIIFSFILRLINPVLYALQKSALPNFLAFIGSLLQVAFLYFYTAAKGDLGHNFIILAWVHALSINIPPLIATVGVFWTMLKGYFPSFSFFSKIHARQILTLGLLFFILQILYMVISATNEFFISHFFDPSYVVEYQIYMKLFSIIGSLVTLALVPVWSAITKAFTEKRFQWIIKLYRMLNYAVVVAAIIQFLMLPFLRSIIEFWLKDNAIAVNYCYAFCFVVYSCVSIWIAIQSSIVAGLGKLKVQAWFYTFAVIFKIAVIILVAKLGGSWITVVNISIVALLPYCVAQPFYIRKALNEMKDV